MSTPASSPASDRYGPNHCRTYGATASADNMGQARASETIQEPFDSEDYTNVLATAFLAHYATRTTLAH